MYVASLSTKWANRSTPTVTTTAERHDVRRDLRFRGHERLRPADADLLGEYADVLEKAFNGSIAGISLDGKQYYYVNALETIRRTTG